MTNHRTIMAANSDADWYNMMSDIQGLRYHRSEIAFLAIDSPPGYHGRITTFDPEGAVDKPGKVKQADTVSNTRPGA